MTNQRKGESTEKIAERTDVEDFEAKVNTLKGTTLLSLREAEIYTLKTQSDELDTLKEVGKFLGIAQNSVYTTWNHIKEKERRAKTTVEEINL